MKEEVFRLAEARALPPRLFILGKKVLRSNKTFELVFSYENAHYTALLYKRNQTLYLDRMRHIKDVEEDITCFSCPKCQKHHHQKDQLLYYIEKHPLLRLQLLV